jgi:retron-type reverse transcriptase
MKSTSDYNEVRTIRNLRAAWNKVKSNALRSPLNSTRQEAIQYDTEIDKHLRRIQYKLRKHKFKFEASHGVAKAKGTGSKRPIVIAPLENRIVQRALLQVLQDIDTLKPIIRVPTSCGGVPERGVKYALEIAHRKICDDGFYYYKSDIKSFFTKIPKSKVIELIGKHVTDSNLLDLLEYALETILINEESLGLDIKLFPLGDLGVAQGSCLSPLMGNLLLNEFDQVTNSEDVICLRYIDDFLIIGPSAKAVRSRLQLGMRELKKLELDVYDPGTDPDKAAEGLSSGGFEFLGCDLRKELITPTRKVRTKMLKNVKRIVDMAILRLQHKEFPEPIFEGSYMGALEDIHNSIKAWGNQYQFCNNKLVMSQLDEKVSSEVDRLTIAYLKALGRFPTSDVPTKRRLLGVHLLVDSKQAPIIR